MKTLFYKAGLLLLRASGYRLAEQAERLPLQGSTPGAYVNIEDINPRCRALILFPDKKGADKIAPKKEAV
jgi:hypothetical protein